MGLRLIQGNIRIRVKYIITITQIKSINEAINQHHNHNRAILAGIQKSQADPPLKYPENVVASATRKRERER